MDPVTVEVIRNSTTYIAEEMGIVLRNTAYSPNIRDRMDHSCAILSPSGELIAQAEHIPVHLGSMAIGVKNTISALESEGVKLEEGDAILVNDPYIAGTHLNDLLLLRPVWVGGEIVAYVANKAHHVDVGGSVPGSISGDAKEIFEEGIILPPVKIVRNNEINRELLNVLLSNVRVPRYTKGDLKAQIAALNVGERRLRELIEKYGVNSVIEAWNKTIEYTESYLKKKMSQVPSGTYDALDYVEAKEELLEIKVTLRVSRDSLKVDFEGTHPQVSLPVNAVYGVTVAASSYAIKAVIDPDLPMNYGFHKVVEIRAPKGTLVNPVKPAPVAAGNVETSQRIAETVLKAFSKPLPERVPAASHGSMNNVMVGGVSKGKTWAFYETIGGGMGGRRGRDGVDGVHTHMTNTMNTPIEVIERECPILFLEYSLRADSGGAGEYRGGLGITRSFKVLSEKATLSLAAERIKTRPWGMLGGMPGQPGEHYVIRSSGETVRLTGKDTVELSRGDIVVIRTPGGGGYGDPLKRDPKKVLEDVLDGKITPGAAERYYRVKIVAGKEGYLIDWDETLKLRGGPST